MSKLYNVYGIGAALVDTEIDVTDNDLSQMGIEKGLMTLVDKEREKELLDYLGDRLIACKRSSGGSTANAIIAIAQFGGKTYYSCKLADDDNGQFYLNDLQKSGVDSFIKKDKNEEDQTGRCLVLISPDAERTLCTSLGINRTLSEEDIEEEIISNSEYVYFEGYMVMSPTTLQAALRIRQIGEQTNVKIALSFSDATLMKNYRNELCQILYKPVDLLFSNRREAFAWAQTDQMDVAIDCLKLVAHQFIVTLGSEGALIYDGKQIHQISPYQVKAVDANGAGDMFAGAFLYAITHGKDSVTAANFASFAAATVVANCGARLTLNQQTQILTQWEKIYLSNQ